MVDQHPPVVWQMLRALLDIRDMPASDDAPETKLSAAMRGVAATVLKMDGATESGEAQA